MENYVKDPIHHLACQGGEITVMTSDVRTISPLVRCYGAAKMQGLSYTLRPPS